MPLPRGVGVDAGKHQAGLLQEKRQEVQKQNLKGHGKHALIEIVFQKQNHGRTLLIRLDETILSENFGLKISRLWKTNISFHLYPNRQFS